MSELCARVVGDFPYMQLWLTGCMGVHGRACACLCVRATIHDMCNCVHA